MSQETNTTKAEYWIGRWKEGKTPWHQEDYNPYLIKYADELKGGRSTVRVFVPLCGKSLDMLWLADQGHIVVGVELAKQAIESFFTENNLTFAVEFVKMAAASEPVEVYKCNEKMITIFCCDLFALMEDDVDGKFDAIWDCGSLSAMAPSIDDRGRRYAKKMRSLLSCDGNYMLESHYYEGDRGINVPACISDALMNEIFGEDFSIRELDVNRLGKDPNRTLPFAVDLRYHLFKPQAN